MDKAKVAQDYIRDLINRDTKVPAEYIDNAMPYFKCRVCGNLHPKKTNFCEQCGQRL